MANTIGTVTQLLVARAAWQHPQEFWNMRGTPWFNEGSKTGTQPKWQPSG